MKLLLGGSPCTYWSIAQNKNRETEAEGLGWELFKNYLIAKEKYKPDYFLYENNKSMATAIRDQITRELGVEPILINSALVSAQNRQRYYWTNIPGVQQPEDCGVYVRDVLEYKDLVPYNGGHFRRTKADPESPVGKSYQIGRTGEGQGQALRVYSIWGKSVTMKANGGGGGAKTGLYFVGGNIYSLNNRGAEKMQTVPSGYTDCVSASKGLMLCGNGWTVDVIAHILGHIPDITTAQVEVLSMYDGMSCGHIALDKLGAQISRYYATEIDKYAIQTTMHNYPDTIQLGDAFQVRDEEWKI